MKAYVIFPSLNRENACIRLSAHTPGQYDDATRHPNRAHDHDSTGQRFHGETTLPEIPTDHSMAYGGPSDRCIDWANPSYMGIGPQDWVSVCSPKPAERMKMKYVGIDISKWKCRAAVMSPEENIIEEFTFPNDAAGVRNIASRHTAEARMVMGSTGSVWSNLYKLLDERRYPWCSRTLLRPVR